MASAQAVQERQIQGKKGMFFDFAQQVWSIHRSKELPIKSSNNEAIRIFSETDELIVFVNSLVEATEKLDGRTTVENSGRERFQRRKGNQRGRPRISDCIWEQKIR